MRDDFRVARVRHCGTAFPQPCLAQALEEQLASSEIDRIVAQREGLVPSNRVLRMERESGRPRGARLLQSAHMRQGGSQTK